MSASLSNATKSYFQKEFENEFDTDRYDDMPLTRQEFISSAFVYLKLKTTQLSKEECLTIVTELWYPLYKESRQ